MEQAGVDRGSVLFRLHELQARRDRVEQRVVDVAGEFLSATGKCLVRVRATRCCRDQYQQQHGNPRSHRRSLTHVPRHHRGRSIGRSSDRSRDSLFPADGLARR